ncbi:MAG: SRPBCC family protein [Reichenbachiella sp.]|uniref:SRPBCC family protein n=1 Tax=Reichenbachiella sp. TaxID=2184521 RepID=UPI003266357E
MKNSNFEISQTIDVSADEAWDIIGAVSGVDQWLGPITACSVEGDKRICSTEEGSFEEDILKVDHANKVLEYAIPSQHMIPVENIHGQMRVEATPSGQATITWSWNFQVTNENEPAAKEAFQMIGGMGIGGIESLIKQKAA